MIRRAVLVLAAVPLFACGGTGSSPCAILTSCGVAAPTSLTVFAAASLQPPFDNIARQLQQRENITTTFSYAGTQTLLAQLTQGAPADVFASADVAHMTAAEDAGLVAGSPRVFAHNRLEIAVEKGNPKGIHGLSDLSRAGLVVVLADPAVPAGKYARQALSKAGVTVHPASLEPQVTGVLSKIALGEADAGIVYVSDVATNSNVDGVPIPDDLNVVADYPIATLKNARDATAADDFTTFVLSADGQAILKAAGFAGV